MGGEADQLPTGPRTKRAASKNRSSGAVSLEGDLRNLLPAQACLGWCIFNPRPLGLPDSNSLSGKHFRGLDITIVIWDIVYVVQDFELSVGVLQIGAIDDS